MWKQLDGNKTNLGVIAGALLMYLVNKSPDDAITWDTSWVVAAVSVITGWTGVAVRSAWKKREKK